VTNIAIPITREAPSAKVAMFPSSRYLSPGRVESRLLRAKVKRTRRNSHAHSENSVPRVLHRALDVTDSEAVTSLMALSKRTLAG
jgi:hypothetical protein